MNVSTLLAINGLGVLIGPRKTRHLGIRNILCSLLYLVPHVAVVNNTTKVLERHVRWHHLLLYEYYLWLLYLLNRLREDFAWVAGPPLRLDHVIGLPRLCPAHFPIVFGLSRLRRIVVLVVLSVDL